MAVNRRKYEQAILFFAHECGNQHLGLTKLMKLLYYLDFDHLERHRRSVTGDRYIHLDYGPVPNSAREVIAEMDGSLLHVSHEDVGAANPRHVFRPLQPYDPSVFSAAEIDTLHCVVERWKDASRDEIVEASHQERPWLLTKRMDEVPKVLALRRHPSQPPSAELREAMFQSVISSLAVEGIEVPEDEACMLFAEAQQALWSA